MIRLDDLLPASPPYPPLPKFLFEPVTVNVSTQSLDYIGWPPKASLQINIYERITGIGIPLAPFTIYLNDEEVYSGVTDKDGNAFYDISFTELRLNTVKVVLVREDLGMPSKELTIAVFKGELYDGGACWWMVGRPYCQWCDEGLPSPKLGKEIWFVSVVKSGSFKKVTWKNTLNIVAHLDHILTSPSGKKYKLKIPTNDLVVEPGVVGPPKKQMGSCVGEYCENEPTLETLNERGTWRLNVDFYGTAEGTGPILLDSKEVTFKVS